MHADRYVTLVVLMLALGLQFAVIPLGAERIDTGVMSPDTLPRALTRIIIVLAAVQLVNPFERVPGAAPDSRQIGRALVTLAILAVAAWLIPVVGFLPGAIFLATGAALIMHERRWTVLVCGGLLLPVAVWLVVTQVLGRALP